MGLFDSLFKGNTVKIHDLKELRELFKSCTSGYNTEDVKHILNEIENFEKSTSSFFIKDEDKFRELIETILINLSTYSYSDEKVKTVLDDAKKMYEYILPFKEQTEDYEHLFKLYVSMFNRNGIYAKDLFSEIIYCSLSDKNMYIEVMNMLSNLKGFKKEYLTYLEIFIIKASPLCASPSILKSSILSFIVSMPTSSNIEDLIERKINDLEKIAGIYHIDRFTLASIDEKLNAGNSIFKRLDSLTLSINEEIALMESMAKKSGSEIDSLTQDKLFQLRKEFETITTKLKLEYNSLIREAKKALESHSKTLLTDFEAKLHGYNDVLDEISGTSEKRIEEIVRRLSTDCSISDLSFLSSSKELKTLIEELKNNPEFISNIKGSNATQVVQTVPSVVSAPAVVIPEKTGLITALDPTIPYKKRFDMLMELKDEDIRTNGSVYHEKTDDIIAMLLSDVTPYLYGPSGCGKTFSVNQICNLIGLPVREVGKIIEEYNILGYNTATGTYQRTNFRNAYECGYTAFIDEIDSGDQNATLILNEFLNTSVDSKYSFPDGVVKRHPNFRVIAAGNTDGNGANFAYSSRHKLDESILQRFKPVYYGYDPRIEEKACKEYPEWLEFTYAYRRALEKVSGNQIGAGAGVNVVGNVTTKDLYVIASWLKNKQFGSKTIEKIMEYQYIGSKQAKMLASIVEAMEKEYDTQNSDSLKLFKAFSSRVEHIRRNGR